MRDDEPRGDSGNGDASGSSDGSEEENAVESLVVGRVKRATAGNRLSSLLEREGGEDDLTLLFAENEEEEDIEFEEEEEDGSDAELDSSTDEEDQGPAKADDDLTGEKELQKEDRLERKKRKAHDVFKKPGALRKRVKIDASATSNSPAPRPKKKSERVSWVHTAADAPTRISSRKQTMQNREIVHRRLVDNQQQRAKIMHQMEEAQKRKDALKPRAMTQAERMEDATKTERKNAKSLNRWEESEKKRVEEQKAKLEALHNRQLSGPVFSLWSGLARWVHGKVGQLGVREIREAGYKEEAAKKSEGEQSSIIERPPSNSTQGVDQDTVKFTGPQPQPEHFYSQPSGYPAGQLPSYAHPTTFAAPQSTYGFLDGIHAYAALPVHQQRAEFTGTADGAILPPTAHEPLPQHQFGRPPPFPIPPQPAVPEVEYSSRNLVALKNVDANALRMAELQDNILLKKRSGKLPSKSIIHHASPITPFHALTLARRAHPRKLRHHVPSSQIPRPQDGLGVREFVRVQRDPETAAGRIAVERSAGLLCRACQQCGARGARTVQTAVDKALEHIRSAICT